MRLYKSLLTSFYLLSMQSASALDSSIDSSVLVRTIHELEKSTQQLIRFESNSEFINDDSEFHIGLRMDLDNYNKALGRQESFELREAYWKRYWKKYQIKVGKQFLSWSQMDDLAPFESISPRNYSQFILEDFDETAIGQWMLNLENDSLDNYFQVIFLPDTKTHKLPSDEEQFALQASRFRFGFEYQQGASATLVSKESNSPLFAARWKHYFPGFEIGLSARKGGDFEPVARYIESENEVVIEQFYEDRTTFGSSLSKQIGSGVFRAEVSYSPSRKFNTNEDGILAIISERQWTLGLGTDLNGPLQSLINLQFMIDRVESNNPYLVRQKTDVISTITLKKTIEEYEMDTEFRLYVANNSDKLMRFKFSMFFSDNCLLKFGLDLFSGNRNGLFGQFEDKDRIYLELLTYL